MSKCKCIEISVCGLCKFWGGREIGYGCCLSDGYREKGEKYRHFGDSVCSSFQRIADPHIKYLETDMLVLYQKALIDKKKRKEQIISSCVEESKQSRPKPKKGANDIFFTGKRRAQPEDISVDERMYSMHWEDLEILKNIGRK